MMNKNKFLRTLAFAVILVLLAVPLSGTPALAAESIDVNPEEGEIGDRIEVTGENFDASDDVYIYFSSQEYDTGDDIDDEVTVYYRKSTSTDADGDLSRYFYVPEVLTRGDDAPEDVHGGTYYIYVGYYGNDNIEAVTEFTIIAGEIALDPEEGAVGTEVEISGDYFEGREDIIVEYDGDEVDIESGDDDTDSDGEFASIILIPESTAGDHTITVEDESDHIAEAQFTVESEIAVTPTSGEVGDEITVSGTGFDGEEAITVTLAGSTITTSPSSIETDNDGSFTSTFIMPDRDLGVYRIKASDGTNDDGVDFDVLVSLSINLSPTTGSVGTSLTVTGTGFIAGRAATVKYGDGVVATVPVNSDRTLSATFAAPASIGGGHAVTVSDGTNTLTSTFTMELISPPVPAPLLPEMGVELETTSVDFDWEDVTDSSGVTYTLQIARDEDFTAVSLEKEGLTKSKYTLPEGMLGPLEEEAPYYWRVMTTDGASNVSAWSTPGSFYIPQLGLSLAMPGWLIYTLVGLGAVLIGFLGFWIGRKTAYSYY